ncbi:MAG TPA: glycosyltransferase family 39 protein, partial [Anaerolineae bacterium]|nr:glycosyltransferase family 39 protein [Anaerolineae bacterium]
MPLSSYDFPFSEQVKGLLVPGWRSPLFYIILTVYLLAGVLFATLTPDWQAPDEPAHYNYVRYLARQSGFPELIKRCYDQAYLDQLTSRRFPAELSLESVCYEFHQPPLYYLLATPVFLLSDGSLLALRLLSVMLGAGVVILAFFISRMIFPNRAAIAYGTMAFVAFVPMHAAMLASFNNDALAELILAALLLLLTWRLLAGSQSTTLNDVILGGLLGLGLITKTTVYIAIPLIAVALWLAAGAAARRRGGEEVEERRSRRSGPDEVARRGQRPGAGGQPLREASQSQRPPVGGGRGYLSWLQLNDVDWRWLARQLLIIYGLALAIALPWYGRNAALYGNFDVLGLGRHDAVV